MRRFLTGIAAAAFMAVVPTLALAGNQEVAEQIARNLRDSGQMSDYKIGVKYQEGVAWLRGRVVDEEQMNTALKLVFQTPGVTRVVNELTVASVETAQAAQSEPASAYGNPLRGQDAAPTADKNQRPQKASLVKRLESMVTRNPEQAESPAAERVSSSYAGTMVQPVAAQESQEEIPQQMAMPQQARPMVPQNMVMQPQYVAMQPQMRGPMVPNGGPIPMYTAAAGAGGVAPARYDQPCLPNYAWPSYAAYPNYAAVTYPKQYSPTAWPYIGPFYPYPQVPLGWRKVTLEWDDGWWFLDFKDQPASCWQR
jgi:hypothetical protein